MLLREYNLSQKDVYGLIGKSRAVFSRYLLPAEDKYHVSMHHRDWLKILEYLSVPVKDNGVKDELHRTK